MNRYPDLSIAQRLGIGFGLVATLVAVLLLVFYGWHEQSGDAQRRYSERIAPIRDGMQALERDVYRVGVTLRSALLDPTQERILALRNSSMQARARLDLLERLPIEPDTSRLFAEIRELTLRYLEQADTALAVRSSRALSLAEEGELSVLRETLFAKTSEFSFLQEEMANDALGVIASTRDAVNRGLGVLAITSLAALAAVALVTARSISGPSRELLGVAAALERGDWQPALHLAPDDRAATARDEMRRIAHAIGSAAAALEQREQRLLADRAVARSIASSLHRDALAHAALEAIVAHVRAEIGVVYSASPDGSMLRPIATHGLTVDPIEIASGDGIPGQAARERATVLLEKIPPDSPFRVKLSWDQAPARSVAAVPLVFRDTLHGVLVVGSLRDLSKDAIAFLEASATQLGIGLQNVASYEETQRLLSELHEKNDRIQAQNEALQVQNEEIQVQNEELQAQSQQLQAQHEEIQAQNEELAQQSEELRRHAAMLAEADERKNHFLGVLAHELRNPMGPILNGLYVLKHSEQGSDQARRAQEVIDRQVGHMIRIIDDLLDVTRISEGKIRVETTPIDLVEVVRNCVEDLSGALEAADIDLELDLPDSPVTVDGDHTRLCQVLGNLLHNAIKFGGRKVELALRVDRDERVAVLAVGDDGVGMDASLLPKLFRPFSQGDSRLARDKGGLGLGLALVKALVELHGGSVHAHSDGPGRGAVFTVRLPITASDSVSGTVRSDMEPAQGLQVIEAPARGATRVLLIEDNVDAARTLREALELEGYEVHVAHTGWEGVRCADAFRPHIVLCDIGLPGLDGYQVARELRRNPATASAMLIALTGYASARDKERAHAAGFDMHFAKPLRLSMLNEVVANLTRHRH